MVRKLVFCFSMLFCINCIFAITFDELIESYDFNYNDVSFKLEDFNYTFENNSLNAYLFLTNNFGNYKFVIDFYHNNTLYFRVFNETYLLNGYNQVNFSIPLKYNFTNYDLNMEIYKDNLIVYRSYFENQVYLSNFTYNKSNKNSSNIIYFNQTKVKPENQIQYLSYHEIKDNKNENIKELAFNFETNLDNINYQTKFYLNNKVFEQDINVEDNKFQIIIKGEDLYKLEINNLLKIQKLILLKNNKIVSSIIINNYTKNYFYENFTKPDLSDLVFQYINQTNSTYINISIINIGYKDSFGVLYKILDNNFEILHEKRIDKILKNQSYFLGSFNLSQFYGIVDYNDEILEDNENNNLFIWPVPIQEETIYENISGNTSENISENISLNNNNSSNEIVSNLGDGINKNSGNSGNSGSSGSATVNSKSLEEIENISKNQINNISNNKEEINKKRNLYSKIYNLKLNENTILEFKNNLINLSLKAIQEKFVFLKFGNQDLILKEKESKLIDLDNDNISDFNLTLKQIQKNFIEYELIPSNLSKNIHTELNFKPEIDLNNNLTLQNPIKKDLDKIQSLVDEKTEVFGLPLLSFIGSIFVGVFSIIFVFL